jgi:putative tricarboxylic transport membrane protein
MNEQSQGAERGPLHRSVEIGVTVFTAIFALVVIYGSVKAGSGWGSDGPQAGFFPFYVGLFILASSIVNFLQVRMNGGDKLFATWSELRQVMAVVVPSVIYVALVPWLGIYVSSVLLIAVFMRWLGNYGWTMVLPIAVGVPLVTFIVFEKWFLVPLPKGPLEAMLGY